MDNVANLAEQMAMMLETTTEGSDEASAMEKALEMSVKMESYKGSVFGASGRGQRLEKDNEAMQGFSDREETEDP